MEANAGRTSLSISHPLLIGVVARPASVLGSRDLGHDLDKDTSGRAEAFRAVAPDDGSINDASVIVAPGSQATNVVVGIYSDAAGHPGTLLTTAPVASALTWRCWRR